MDSACHLAVVPFLLDWRERVPAAGRHTPGLATRREDTLQRNDERYSQVRLLNIDREAAPCRAGDEWGHGLV